MTTIYHKARTIVRIMRSSSDLGGGLARRARINLGQLRIKLAHEKPFAYKTAVGFPFVCIPGSQTSAHLYFNGGPEELEARIANVWAQQGDNCIDVGANIGYYTALLAARVGATGRVLAVEPSPPTFALLRRGVARLALPQVSLEQVCVSDEVRGVEFMVATSEVDSVFQSMAIDAEHATGFTKVVVQAETIDSLLDRHTLRGAVSLVKIDIEGAEPLALRGAAALFEEAALPLFIIEVNRESLGNFGLTPADVTTHFPRELFDAYFVNFNYWDARQRFEHGVPYPWRSRTDDMPELCNMIFVPKVGKYHDRRGRVSPLLRARA